MSGNRLISILIPVYNAERFLGRCLDSALGQTLREIEVVAVNDGSTDGSLALLRAYAARDSRLRVVDKPNEGVMLTRQRCVAEASADWAFFLDADDYISPDSLEKLWGEVQRRGCDIAASSVMRVKNGYETVIWQHPEGSLDGTEMVAATLNQRISNGLLGRLYRRELLLRAEYYPGISIGEDMLLNIQIALQSDFRGICFAPEAVYYYIQHGGSLTHGSVGLEYQEHFAEVFDSIFEARPEVAERLAPELLRERVMRLLVYIKRSHNPWRGDTPLAERTYREVRDNLPLARRATPAGSAAMVLLYRRRALKPLVIAIATLQRWSVSISRRLKSRKQK